MKLSVEKAEDNVLIIGCGRLGSCIANSLSNENKNVTIIDKDKDAFRKLSPSFGGLALEGDATDLDILKEAEIDKSKVVLSVTDDDNTNIMIAQMTKNMFAVGKVIVRLYDPDRECIYKESGIETILPSILSINEIEKILGAKQ